MKNQAPASADREAVETLGSLAAQALDEAQGDRAQANRRLIERLRLEPAGRALMDKALSLAAANAIAGVIAYRRRRILAVEAEGSDDLGPGSTDADVSRGGRVVILASARLSDFPLPSGKRLGTACKWEVQEAADIFRVRADTLVFRARWLQAIASLLPPDKTVLDALSDADLEALARQSLEGRAGGPALPPRPMLPAAE